MFMMHCGIAKNRYNDRHIVMNMNMKTTENEASGLSSGKSGRKFNDFSVLFLCFHASTEVFTPPNLGGYMMVVSVY